MHSNCLIPGVRYISVTGSRPGQRWQSSGHRSSASKAPEWRVRRENKLEDRRLSRQLASLNHMFEHVTSRIDHDIRRVISDLSPTPQTLYQTYDGQLTIRRLSSADSGFTSESVSQISSTLERPEYIRLLDGTALLPSAQTRVGGNSSERNNRVPKSISLPALHVSCMEQDGLEMKQWVDTKNTRLLSGRLKSSRYSKYSARPCEYGISKESKLCNYFPCRRSKTYNSLGFSTISKKFPPKSNTPRAIHRGGTDGVSPCSKGAIYQPAKHRSIPFSSSTCRQDSLKHRLPSAARLRPMDAAFREQLLKEESKRRREEHRKLQPVCWEINYGQPTPFKHLWYPVRLKPSQFVSL